MKLKIKQLLVLACLLISTLSFGQAPQKFNYQGIARDVKGNPLAKQKMSLKISVLPTQDATVSEYEETQMVTTNEFGLYTLQIGAGTPISGEMKTVKWETGNKYIKIAIDQKGGTDYVDAGTTQLLSVPYAIYADKAGLARETVEGTDKTRTGTVSSNAAHVAGDANYVSKFTALNTIGKSSIYDNGTNVGIGTSSPAATLNLKSTSSNELLRMQSTSSTGFGKFTMYNDLNYATFTKYGSTAPGTYFGLSSFPNASLLAFGNNGGGFLISNGGNVGLSILKASSKMKFYIDYNTENVGIGGNANAATQIHFNSDKTGDTLKITNTTTGHTATDGLDIRNNGNAAEIVNRENSSLAFGTNNAERMRIDASGFVGIGTTAPTSPVTVYSPTSSSMSFKNSSTGNTLTDGLWVGNSSTTSYIWNYDNGSINFGTNNSERMIIDETGNVGIGTASPNAKLEIKTTEAYETMRADGGDSMYVSLYENGVYRGYIGSYSGNDKDVDFGSGLSTNGKTHLTTNAIPRLTVDSAGYVGIGTTTPIVKLDITDGELSIGAGSTGSVLNLTNTTNISTPSIGFLASFGDAFGIEENNDGQLRFTPNTNSTAGSTSMLTLDDDSEYIGIGTDAPAAKLDVVGQVKISGGTPGLGEVLTSDAAGLATWETPSITSSIGTTNYVPKFTSAGATLGNSQIQDNGTSISIGTLPATGFGLQVYRSQLTANGDGQNTLRGYRTRDSQNDGVSYGVNGINTATEGYNFWGDVYTFGVAGHSYNDYNRTGGVLGAEQGGSYWGSLGYRSSGLLNYGVYGTSAYASGTGYLPTNEVAGIGGGFFGSMVGSVSKGKVIGQMNSGELFASYNLGDEYTSGKQIELVDNGAEKVAAYSVTSTELTIYKKGKINLVNGTAFVAFDKNYSSLLADVPVVTITPMGACNGVYIESISKEGFTVKELNNGSSNVNISWISVADRIDNNSERTIPSEVLANSFDTNLQKSMYDDGNKENATQGMWWDGASKSIKFGIVPASTTPKRKVEDLQD